MKHNLVIWMWVLILTACVGEDQKGSIRIMSFNIRYDNPSDGANRWENRRDLLVGTIIHESPDVIGMQEVLINQLQDLDSLLPWYDYVGVGRDDGREKGEFSPIFYKMSRFELKDVGTFWLSPYPDSVGSVGWDAALPRIATWARFFDRHVQKEFMAINTHFDHLGDTARTRSAALIKDFISEKGNLPVLLTGDFNFESSAEGYKLLTREGESVMHDARNKSILEPRGVAGTFNGFEQPEGTARIDYIFVSPHWRVYEYETVKVLKDGVYISDHWPVVANVKVVEE